MNLYLAAGIILLVAFGVALAFILGAVVKRRDMQIPHNAPPRHYGEKTFNLGDWNGN